MKNYLWKQDRQERTVLTVPCLEQSMQVCLETDENRGARVSPAMPSVTPGICPPTRQALRLADTPKTPRQPHICTAAQQAATQGSEL